MSSRALRAILGDLPLVAASLGAQVPAHLVRSADATVTSGAPSVSWGHAAWLSGGVGLGASPSGSLAGVGAAWYSIGAVAVGGRVSRVGGWFGEQRADRAGLVGVRTRGHHAFLLGGVGPTHVTSSRTCDGPCMGVTRPSATGAAYSVEAHGASTVVGGVLSLFGVLGPATTRFHAVALSVSVGWFGE